MRTVSRMFIALTLLGLLAACAAPPVAVPAAATEASAALAAPTALPLTPEQEAWLKTAGVGPYAPEKEDWAAIEAAARQEGKVVFYTMIGGSLVAAGKAFNARYPGIVVEMNSLSITAVGQRLREEQGAGIYQADVYYNGDYGVAVNEFLPQHYLWNYVPDDTAPFLLATSRSPILAPQVGGRIFIYNSELNQSCPITNWWDLTEPAWKGKFIMPDPSAETGTAAFLAIVSLHGDDLARAYEEKYGQPPTLDADTPNAGYLWIKRLAANQPVLAANTGKPAEGVGTKGMKEAPIGVDNYYFYWRVAQGQLAFEPCLGLKPALGIQNITIMGIVNRAPHPNAAKLLIHFMLSSEGSQPMLSPGSYWARTNVPPVTSNIPREQFEQETWAYDPVGMYQMMPRVRDFWLAVTAR